MANNDSQIIHKSYSLRLIELYMANNDGQIIHKKVIFSGAN